jgi:hypothetical protein
MIAPNAYGGKGFTDACLGSGRRHVAGGAETIPAPTITRSLNIS